jgi:hypothetical protein
MSDDFICYQNYGGGEGVNLFNTKKTFIKPILGYFGISGRVTLRNATGRKICFPCGGVAEVDDDDCLSADSEPNKQSAIVVSLF